MVSLRYLNLTTSFYRDAPESRETTESLATFLQRSPCRDSDERRLSQNVL